MYRSTNILSIKNSITAWAVTLILFATTLLSGPAAMAANFSITSASTNTAGTQILLHTAVAIDPTNSAKVPANFVVTVNGVARASTTYTVGFSSSDVVLALTSGTLISSNVVTVSYTRTGNNKIVQQGASNNTLSNTASPISVTNNVPVPDTTPPTFTAMTANTAGTNITITYNEPLLTSSVPAASAFTVTQDGVTISNTTYTVAVATTTVTLTFGSATIVNNSVVRLSYAVPGSGQLQDLAGNAAAAITSNLVANPVPDTTAPRVLGRATNVAGTVVSIFFNEPLSTTNVPDAADFLLQVNGNNYPTSSISVDIVDSQVNLHLTSTPIVYADALLLTYTHNVSTAKQIQDVAHNIGNSTANEPVTNQTLDLGVPIFQGAASNIAGTQITIQYSTPLLTTSVPTASDYSLTIGGVVYSNITPSISGNNVVIALNGTPINYGQAINLDYLGNSVKRESNNISAAAFTNQIVDNLTLPGVAPVTDNGTTSSDGYWIYVNMSKPLDETHVPLPSDFAIKFDDVAYTGSYTVAISGSVITLHLSIPAGHLTYVEVAYTPGLAANRIRDLSGTEAIAWIDLDVTNMVIDTTPPTVVSRVTSIDGTKLIVTFSEQLCESCLPLTSDLYLVFDGTRYDPANYSMSIAGATYTFTLTGAPITYGQTIRLSYVPNAVIMKRVQDLAGNQLPPTNNAVITNLVPSTGAPVVTSKSINQTGTVVTVAYDRDLDATSIPASSEFTLKVNGSEYLAGFVVGISGSNLTLTLSGAAVTSGATVTLTYSGTSVKANVGGVAATTFTDNTVNSFVRPELVTLATDNSTGRHIYLTYNVPLLAGSVPVATDFVLTINGVVYSTSNYSVSITGSSVILDLQLTGAAIRQTDVVRLTYTPGTAPIKDQAGNDAPPLGLTVVSNRVPDTTAPENVSLVTNLIGSEIIWTYNEPLDPTRVPLAGDFVLTVNGSVYANTNYTVGVDDSRTVLYLSGSRIRFGQDVLLAYTPGLSGNQLADPAGNVIQSEPRATVLNMVSSTAVPNVTSMVTNTTGTQILITYNEQLNATQVPLSSDFVFSLNDVVYASSDYTVSVSGAVVTLTLNGARIPNGVRADVQYIPGVTRITDLDGNYADPMEKSRVTNLVPDTTSPSVISRVSNTAGDKIIITFSEPLNAARLPLTSDIALVFDGVRYDPANYTMAIVGSVFTFSLTGPAIRFGQALRLSYTRNLADSNLWVQDLAGNLVNNSVSQSVDNLVPDTALPVLVSAATNVLGDQITLNYNYSLDTASAPSAADFTLRVNGSAYVRADYTLSVVGSTVVINLNGSAIGHGAGITLSYTGNHIKRASNGLSAATFGNLTVTNAVPDTTAPVVLLRDEIAIHNGDIAVTSATADDEVTWLEAEDVANLFAIDSVTGVITASASAPLGTYSYTVTAVNDAGIETDATITILVRPTPIIATNGGENNLAPLPPMATRVSPVIGITTPVAETRVVARLDTYLGDRVVSVLEPAEGVAAGSTIAIKPGPYSDESNDGRFTVEITVTSASGENVTEFRKVFTINMGQYVPDTLPAHSADGVTWPTLPLLKGDWLPAGFHDGYYIDAGGNLIILTHHMTMFGLKKNQQAVHELRLLTGPTRIVVGGEFEFKVKGGLGAGKVTFENLTPELCSIQQDLSVHALRAGECLIRTVKLGDGVYADAISQVTKLTILNPSVTMTAVGWSKAVRVNLGKPYAGKTVSLMVSTPSVHPFTLYRRVTLDEDGVAVLRGQIDSHATFRVVSGNKIVVDAKPND